MPATKTLHDSALAQLVEQMTVNHWVAGSSPAGGAKSFRLFVQGVPNYDVIWAINGCSAKRLPNKNFDTLSHIMGLLDRPTDRKAHIGTVPLVAAFLSIYPLRLALSLF